MAAPYVASLVIKILEKEPNLTIKQIREKLFMACDPAVFTNNSLEVFRAGNGYVNPHKIIN
jgi:hypothetical protein